MNIIKKMIAIFSIFVITFTDFAFLSKAYATTLLESIFSDFRYDGEKNIEFDAYFEDAGKNKSYSVFSAVNGWC